MDVLSGGEKQRIAVSYTHFIESHLDKKARFPKGSGA